MKKCKIFLKQRVKHLVQLKSKLIEKRVENSLKCFARRYEYVWGEFLWKNMILFNMVTDWNVNLLMKKCLLGVKVKQHSFTLTPTFLSVIYTYKCIYIYILYFTVCFKLYLQTFTLKQSEIFLQIRGYNQHFYRRVLVRVFRAFLMLYYSVLQCIVFRVKVTQQTRVM